MRRGLMGWNAEELPKAALEARIARLRDGDGAGQPRRRAVLHQPCAAERGDLAHRLHAVLVRRACCWCTEEGAPVFATALSKRVANWIRTTDTLSEIVNTPKPGAAVGKRIAAAGCKRAGVLEFDALPAGLYDEIVGAAPAIALVDMGSDVRRRAPRHRRRRARADRARRRVGGGGA